MGNYFQAASYDHQSGEQTALLLVNLGTPAAPTARAVRPYLREFLSDRRVVEVPRWLWWLILRGVILPFRSSRSAAAYAKIWRPEGSPLLYYTQQLSCALAQQPELQQVLVAEAMTYGEPAIAGVLQQLQKKNVRRLLVLPLYPQYSATTTASVFDAVTRCLQKQRWLPELRFINQYFQWPEWSQAVADSIRSYRQAEGTAEQLLFSFHGIPQRYFRQGDPYYCQCHASARMIAAQLQLSDSEWQVSFQSRLGREPWLQPYTDHVLEAIADKGGKHVQVVCPGFAVDCLETLEEIAMQNEELFIEAGGERLDYIPALNAEPAHARLLAKLVSAHLQGWPPTQTTDDGHRQQRALQSARRDNYAESLVTGTGQHTPAVEIDSK